MGDGANVSAWSKYPLVPNALPGKLGRLGATSGMLDTDRFGLTTAGAGAMTGDMACGGISPASGTSSAVTARGCVVVVVGEGSDAKDESSLGAGVLRPPLPPPALMRSCTSGSSGSSAAGSGSGSCGCGFDSLGSRPSRIALNMRAAFHLANLTLACVSGSRSPQALATRKKVAAASKVSAVVL